MQTETDIGQYEMREVDENFPRGVRRSENNNKLPPLAGSKGSEMDYAKRNMEIIKQLKEKKQKQQEIIEEKRKKEAEEREKLRQLILEEAARVRELKKQNSALQQETEQKEEGDKSFRGKKSKTKEIKEKEDEETEKEKEDKAKLQHYYRSRHASFLKSLKENLKSKKDKEEQDKKKKDEILSKIRENMGINNITSKLYSVEKHNAAEIVADDQTLNVKKVNSASEAKRASSVEGRTLPIEVQRELLQKQKRILAEISERKKLEKLEEEEKQKHYFKIREKLKDKVLNMGKSETANFGAERKVLTEDPAASQNLKALNLDSIETKRQRFKKSLGSLPPIRDKYMSENDDGQKESNSLPKIPESTKSSKSAKKTKKKLTNIPNITDMVQWKKRHRLDPEAKIYSVVGGYGDIKAALDKRGWIENPDLSSPCFDFKWTLRAKDIDHGTLLENQIVNHFEKNTSITTKVGLCKSLKNLIWFNNVDIDTFYPRCFDLTDVADYEDFLDEFKRVKAESILKQYVIACKNNDPKVKDMELRVQVAARVCENRLIDLDELLDDQTMISHVLVSAEEWEILANDELSAKDLALKKHEAWLSKYDITNGPKCAFRKKKPEKGNKKKKKKKKTVKQETTNAEADGNKEEGEGEGEGEEDDNVSENELLDRVETILEELKAKYPQYGLNGEKNIWIVKPAGLSRGRGISCFRNLVEIQDYVKGKESQWVVQKYLENPLIVHKRKFDIRQWILVTDWNPLTIWFFEECYVRFSAEEYGTENLDNKFVHLTNNSIGKYHENQDCPTFEQNMWGMGAFAQYLEQTFGSGTFEEKIKPQMKQIVIWALECVQDMVENRKGSHEFYGVDFMIDDDLRVWLIEINSSPDMEYSTPVTKRLVKTVSDDIIKVVVDYNLNPSKKKKKEIDTGLFTCIHKSKRTIEKPLNSFGLDLLLEGKKISK